MGVQNSVASYDKNIRIQEWHFWNVWDYFQRCRVGNTDGTIQFSFWVKSWAFDLPPTKSNCYFPNIAPLLLNHSESPWYRGKDDLFKLRHISEKMMDWSISDTFFSRARKVMMPLKCNSCTLKLRSSLNVKYNVCEIIPC